MLGYYYEIIYKNGKENVVEYSLSQKYEEEWPLFSLCLIIAYWLNDVCKEWFKDPKISRLIQQLQTTTHSYQGYTWHNEELHYKGYLYLNKNSTFKSIVLSELHASPIIGHFGFHKKYEMIKCSFFWESMKKDIYTFVAHCNL
jgi:hypothetical protein